MRIEMDSHRNYLVLELTFVEIWEFSAFNEVLIYQFINELIKYWTPDINKHILKVCKFWLHIRILHASINLDFNLHYYQLSYGYC